MAKLKGMWASSGRDYDVAAKLAVLDREIVRTKSDLKKKRIDADDAKEAQRLDVLRAIARDYRR